MADRVRGSLFHLLCRGNERRDIFRTDADRRLFLETLGEGCERFGIELFAYVLQLSCYIHRNPLRAGLVQRIADYRWSSYSVYAYGQEPPEWLATRLILSHFNAANPHRAYREKVQHYAREEARLWGDFRHGFIMGSKRFVASVRNRFLPEHLAAAVPQQLRLARDKELHVILKAAAQQIGCDLPRLIEARRVSGIEKEKRDALIYWVWKAGRFTNGQIGKLFGLTYSAVSHSILEMKRKLSSDKELRTLFERINSQFKL